MTTKYKLSFEESPSNIDLKLFQQSLPDTFGVEEEGDNVFLLVETQKEEDQLSQYQVERELDRIFFLTNVKIQAEMLRKHPRANFEMPYRYLDDLPDGIAPQKWAYELPLQLKLWSMADSLKDVRLQVLYYFHIIELAYPNREDFPRYTNQDETPNALTECKFLRHLIAHAGDVKSKELKLYCSYLDIPELMFDVTDCQYQEILLGKIPLLEEQAKKAIEESLIKTSPEIRDFLQNRYVKNVSMNVCVR